MFRFGFPTAPTGKRIIKLRSALALAVSLAVVSSVFIPTSSAQATTLYPDDCAPAVLMVRGSGEGALATNSNGEREYIPSGNPEADPYIVTNGQEGEVIGRLIRKFVDKTYENGTENLTVSKVRFIGVDYESLPVFPELNDYASVGAGAYGAIDNAARIISHIFNYDSSYRDGAKRILEVIQNDQRRGCETQYTLMGYSQGMISVRIALNLLGNDTSKIVSTYAVGDPFQNPDGVTSSYQVSGASSSPNSEGVGLFSLNTIIAIDQLVHPANISELSDYRDEVTSADPMIYRIGDSQKQYSRVLCHQYDLVCSPGWGSGITEHTSYFNFGADAGTSGYIDILELEEFDKQVRTLAGSTFQSPGTRQLAGSAPIDGKATYNVKNARLEIGNEDKCSWDVDSDGYYEESEIDCGTYDAVHSTSLPTAKITVKVEDSFGNFHILNLDRESISSKDVEQITTLDPDKWYQFHPYGEAESCIGFSAQDNYADVAAGMTLAKEDCEQSSAPIAGFEEKASISKQIFQATPHHAANYPGESDEFGTRLAWGYDEDYNLDSFDSYSTDGPVKLQLNDDYSSHHFEPRLAKVENGVPYYFIRHRDGNCITIDDYDAANINWGCDGYSESQLFSVTPVDGDFGDLSLEKDTTAPSAIENLSLSVISYNSATLSWDESIDDRLGDVKYEVYEKNDIGENLIDTISGTSIEIDASGLWHEPGKSFSFSVKAVDSSNNKTNEELITFSSSTILSKPEPPTLESLSDLGEAVIHLPYSDTEPVEKVAVYKNGYFAGFSNDHFYYDSGLMIGQEYEYTYKTVTSYDLYSEMSDTLVVKPTDNIAPSSPAGLSLNWQYGNQVSMSWTQSFDGADSSLTYHIYRDGVRLENDFDANETGGADYSAAVGSTHVYTVRAEDSSGNLSEPSNELVVTIPVPDVTAPTPPTNLSLLSQYGNTVSIGWDQGIDDVGSYLNYQLYRDGVELTENYGTFESGAFDYDAHPGVTYIYTARSVDPSGNISEESEPLSVTVTEPPAADTTPPTTPLLTLLDIGATTARFSISSSDTEDTPYFEIYRDGSYQSTIYGDEFTDYNLQPESTYEYTVLAWDNSGNVSSVSDPLVVTTTLDDGGGNPPATTLPSVADFELGYTSHSVVQFSWELPENGGLSWSYDVYRDGVLVADNRSGNPYAGGISTEMYSYTDFDVVPNESYSYQIVLRNYMGNTSLMSEPFIIQTTAAPEGSDTFAPSATKIVYSEQGEYGASMSWTPAVDDNAVASYRVYRDGVLLDTITVVGDVHNNYYDDATVIGSPEGTVYTYQIVVVDSSGNENSSSPPFDIVIY